MKFQCFAIERRAAAATTKRISCFTWNIRYINQSVGWVREADAAVLCCCCSWEDEAKVEEKNEIELYLHMTVPFITDIKSFSLSRLIHATEALLTFRDILIWLTRSRHVMLTDDPFQFAAIQLHCLSKSETKWLYKSIKRCCAECWNEHNNKWDINSTGKFLSSL